MISRFDEKIKLIKLDELANGVHNPSLHAACCRNGVRYGPF
jgi:hypothetical protein